MHVSEEDVRRLAALSRIKLETGEERVFRNDLERILEYFEELKTAETKNVPPVASGTAAVNVISDDEARPVLGDADRLIHAFPEREGRYLKVPPVFPQ